MHRVLVLGLLLSACVEPSPTPRELPWSAHAIAASSRHTLVLTDRDEMLEAGTVETDGDPVPLPVDPATDTEISLVLPIATAIAVGTQHACVISATQVLCWGEDNHGALGAHRACSTPSTCVLGPEVMPTLPPIRAIAAGDDVTCATTMDDEVLCWGEAAGGRLGGSIVSALDPPVPVMLSPGKPLHVARVMIRDATVCAIDRSQQGWCWVVGGRHTCALDDLGNVWCWGDNEDGQLARTDAFLVGDRGTRVVFPAPGGASTTRLLVERR